MVRIVLGIIKQRIISSRHRLTIAPLAIAFGLHLAGSPLFALSLEERLEVQSLLAALGQPVQVDGAIGPATRAACDAVLSANGFTFEGSVDAEVLETLRELFYSGQTFGEIDFNVVSRAWYEIDQSAHVSSSRTCGGSIAAGDRNEGLMNVVYEAADFNGDGYDDLIIFTYVGVYSESISMDTAKLLEVRPTVLLWSPEDNRYVFDDNFSSSLQPTVWPRRVFFEDFDKDGYLDMFIADHGNDSQPTCGFSNRVYRNVDGRHFVLVDMEEQFDYSHAAAIFDFDGDGDSDILVLNSPYIYPEIHSLCSSIYGSFNNQSYFLRNMGEMRFDAKILNNSFQNSPIRAAIVFESPNGEKFIAVGVGSDHSGSSDVVSIFGFKDWDLTFKYDLKRPVGWGDGLVADFELLDLNSDGDPELLISWALQSGCCGWNGNYIQVIEHPYEVRHSDITTDVFGGWMGADRLRSSFCWSMHAVDIDLNGTIDLICNMGPTSLGRGLRGPQSIPSIFLQDDGKLSGKFFANQEFRYQSYGIPVMHGGRPRLAMLERFTCNFPMETIVVELPF